MELLHGLRSQNPWVWSSYPPMANCAIEQITLLFGSSQEANGSICLIGLWWEWNGLMQAVFNTAPGVTRAVMNYPLLWLHAGGGYWRGMAGGLWCKGSSQIRLCLLLLGALVLAQAWIFSEIKKEPCVWNCGWWEMERNKHQGTDLHKIPFFKVVVVSVCLNVFHHSICYIGHHLRGGNGGVLESSPRQQYTQP